MLLSLQLGAICSANRKYIYILLLSTTFNFFYFIYAGISPINITFIFTLFSRTYMLNLELSVCELLRMRRPHFEIFRYQFNVKFMQSSSPKIMNKSQRTGDIFCCVSQSGNQYYTCKMKGQNLRLYSFPKTNKCKEQRGYYRSSEASIRTSVDYLVLIN